MLPELDHTIADIDGRLEEARARGSAIWMRQGALGKRPGRRARAGARDGAPARRGVRACATLATKWLARDVVARIEAVEVELHALELFGAVAASGFSGSSAARRRFARERCDSVAVGERARARRDLGAKRPQVARARVDEADAPRSAPDRQAALIIARALLGHAARQEVGPVLGAVEVAIAL
jgi:hypothetical protein